MVYMGLKSIFNSNEIDFDKEILKGGAISFFQGFSISILNPKIFIWFIAIYSQFMSENNNVVFNFYLIITAGIVDTLWYIFLTILATSSMSLSFLKAKSGFLKKITGYLFLVIGSTLMINIFI